MNNRSQSRKYSVLFVDDDEMILGGLQRLAHTRAKHWNCRFATCMDEALKLIRQQCPDVVVSDYAMDGGTGLDLLKAVRHNPVTTNTPFILLTGYADQKRKLECLEAGATEFLSKPCDFIEFTTRINNVVELKLSRDLILQQNEELERRVALRTKELEDSHREIVLRLAKASDKRDTDTGKHILRVGLICRILAEELGMSAEEQNDLFLASTLHDIGKIGIHDDILLKPGRLTPEEREEMERHCALGWDILYSAEGDAFTYIKEEVGLNQGNDILALAAEIAISHHEKWDGTGYPNGLEAEQIPLCGRIVAVADVFDALRSKRPYKDPIPRDKAFEIMQSQAGTHFDPTVFDAFARRIDDAEFVIAQFSDFQEQVGEAA